MKFFDDLKRRNVPKASLAYLVIAWVLLQVFSLLLPMFKAPEWVLKTLTLILAIGFPLWVIFSWTYEITPEGIKKTKEVSKDNSITETTNKRLNILILIALVIAITIGLMFKPLFNNDPQLTTHTTIFDKSIAVLPFDDMSSSGDNEWFCDGMTEDILTKLSMIKELKVISRTSTEQYKNSDKTIPEIAKELGVSYILEGSVRKHENKIIITAQLIDLNDTHLWADNYNDNFEEVFEIQQGVAEKIVEQLKITISPEEEKALATYPTDNMEAYQLYLQGRNFIEKFGEENSKIAADLFKQAIELDPDFGDAYAELGFASYEENNDSINAIAARYVEKALKMNPNSSRALAYYGMVLIHIEKNEKEGVKYLEKAITANPNDAKALDLIAMYYVRLIEENEGLKKENLEKGLYHINRAVELDPLSPQSNYLKIMVLLRNELVEEAKVYFDAKKSLFSSKQLADIKLWLDSKEENLMYKKADSINKKAKKIGIENKDRSETVLFLKKEVNKDPNNHYLNRLLGQAYDGILNDDVNYVKYTKIAYFLDSSNVSIAREYYTALSENRQFEDAMKLYNTENYKKITSEIQKLGSLYYLYYNQKKYKKSLEILNDTVMRNQYNSKLVVYSQLGKKDKAHDLLANKNISINSKAMAYAILKEKDSMYVYLNRDDMDYNFINGRREFDPYRNEKQFKEVLKKHYLPITPTNE